MSFPATVRDEAMVACGRHCCICHQFCGLKMELHHIRLQSEGGEDTLENCIPLCLDCHADMRSYDARHPKGTKYTPTELRGHRDRWYAKVRTTGLSASDEQHRGSDRQTMRRLVQILPWDGAIEFIRQQHFGEPFDRRCFRDLWAFKTECSNPAFEFLDADLDGLRAALLSMIVRFQNVYAAETFTLDSDLDWSQVPPELKWREPERYARVIDDIHAAASAVCDTYDQLIRSGRRKLGVPDAG